MLDKGFQQHRRGPPDGVSQLLLALPMCVLYELGLFAARYFKKPVEETGTYLAPTDAQMDGDLDRVDVERK